MVKKDTVPSEDVDNGGVEGEAKPSREEILEDDHFVVMGLRKNLRLRWDSSEARREYTSFLHVL